MSVGAPGCIRERALRPDAWRPPNRHTLVAPRSCRHRALPLVCQRFWRLVNSPQLLASISLVLEREPWVPRLRALCHWLLLRAAGCVRRLRLEALQYVGTEQEAGEAEALATAIAMACAAGGGLEQLELLGGLCLGTCSSWLVALRGLRRLSLQCSEHGYVAVTASLEALSSLQELHLSAEVMLLPTAAFPRSLTKLALGPTTVDGAAEEAGSALPSQASLLAGSGQPGERAISHLPETADC